jgi:hypothetical protein
MWWRLKRSEFDNQKGEQNKQTMKEIVDSDEILGIMVYHNDQPIAWYSIALRENYSLMGNRGIHAN